MWVDDFLQHCFVRGLRPNTIAQAGRTLQWLQDFTGKAPERCTARDLDRFLARRAHSATRATEWSYLSMFFKWAVKFEVIERNPLAHIERPRVPRKKPRPMPDADLARALHTSKGRVRAWFWLGAYAGLRACDIAPLRAEHILWEHDLLLVPETKGGGERHVPIPKILAPVLEDLPREGWLFPRRDGRDGHVTAHLVSELTGRHLRKSGAHHPFHSCRAWYLTHAQMISGDIVATQELAGHKNPATTVGYTFVSMDRLAAIVDQLPRLAVA